MPIFNQCCCCSLKTGCKTLASFAIIGNIIMIAMAVMIFVVLSLKDAKQIINDISNQVGIDGSVATGCFLVFGVVLLILSITSMIVYSCLIHGVNHRKEGFLVPALVLIPIESIFVVVLLCIGIIWSLIALAFNILIWLVIFSSWQEIKMEKRGGAGVRIV